VISNWLVIALMVSARIGHAGGVAVYGTVKLICKVVLKQPSESNFEYIRLGMANISHERTLLGCVYKASRTIDY